MIHLILHDTGIEMHIWKQQTRYRRQRGIKSPRHGNIAIQFQVALSWWQGWAQEVVHFCVD